MNHKHHTDPIALLSQKRYVHGHAGHPAQGNDPVDHWLLEQGKRGGGQHQVEADDDLGAVGHHVNEGEVEVV